MGCRGPPVQIRAPRPLRRHKLLTLSRHEVLTVFHFQDLHIDLMPMRNSSSVGRVRIISIFLRLWLDGRTPGRLCQTTLGSTPAGPFSRSGILTIGGVLSGRRKSNAGTYRTGINSRPKERPREVWMDGDVSGMWPPSGLAKASQHAPWRWWPGGGSARRWTAPFCACGSFVG